MDKCEGNIYGRKKELDKLVENESVGLPDDCIDYLHTMHLESILNCMYRYFAERTFLK